MRLRACCASSFRLLLTSHVGVSGMKGRPANMSTGNRSRPPIRILYEAAEWIDCVPSAMPDATSCEQDCKNWYIMSIGPRTAAGATSPMYSREVTVNMPTPRPIKRRPSTMTPSKCVSATWATPPPRTQKQATEYPCQCQSHLEMRDNIQ